MTDPMVVLSGLDVEARRPFIEIAWGMIDSDQDHIELDCSQVDALDEQTLGMLVTVARKAQRRGQRVVLDLPSERVRHDLDDAGSVTSSRGPRELPVAGGPARVTCDRPGIAGRRHDRMLGAVTYGDTSLRRFCSGDAPTSTFTASVKVPVS